MYLLPMTIGVSKVTSHMFALAPAARSRRKAISNCTDDTCSSQVQLLFWFVHIIYRGTSVLLRGVSFISVVEPQFRLFV